MDGSLFRVLQVQLKFGTLLHKSVLRPYLSVQIVQAYVGGREKAMSFKKYMLQIDFLRV